MDRHGKKKGKNFLAVSVGEILLLLFLLFLLVGAIGMCRPRPSRLRPELVNIQQLGTACEAYLADWGEYPPVGSAGELARILSERHGEEGPYAQSREPTPEEAMTDPWRTPLLYERSPDGQSFRLGSAGLDRKFGTEDDFFVESQKLEKGEVGSEH